MSLLLRILGILTILSGLLWAAQGAGIFPYPAESFMIDQRPWILWGACAVVIGIVLLIAGGRRRRRL